MTADRPSVRPLGRDRPLVRHDPGRRGAGRLIRPSVQRASRCSRRAPRKGSPASPPHPAQAASQRAWRLRPSACHRTGTVAAGASAQGFPTEPRGRLRGVHGVVIADASVLPAARRSPPDRASAAAPAIAEAYPRG
ncbi:GMC oxidoreductase [Streptomyces sp. NK08204]|uniref:GMC oxidoreductase n=1 Tax=Streptomyces sp. NK08204 TaxID=2873260 RepID=UPI001CEDD95B|nr:GMC oxidoreductase [Streptomyces sp. NK08204]